MDEIKASPCISHVSWGRLTIDDGRIFKDAKLFPGGAREWDWSETGTRHVPGIQPEDVEELLEHGATTIVLSKGIRQRLRTCPETLDLLASRGVTVHVLQTEEAAKVYNELRQNSNVAGLFHSTC